MGNNKYSDHNPVIIQILKPKLIHEKKYVTKTKKSGQSGFTFHPTSSHHASGQRQNETHCTPALQKKPRFCVFFFVYWCVMSFVSKTSVFFLCFFFFYFITFPFRAAVYIFSFHRHEYYCFPLNRNV